MAGVAQISGHLFLQLANRVPAYLWIGDANGYITFLNDVWYRNTGRTPEQSLGTAWAEVLHPDDVDRCLRIWQESLSQGSVYEVEVRYRMADGIYRWVLARAEPLKDASGRVTNWFGTSIDIEDRKRAEQKLQEARDELERRVEERTAELAEAMDDLKESQRQFRLAVEHYPSTFVIYDADRRIQYINSTGAAVIGLPESEIIGHRDEEVRQSEGLASFRPLLDQAFATGERQTSEVTVQRDGRNVTLIVNYVPILEEDGAISQVLGITHDITARKEAEEQREVLHKAVETAGEGIAVVSADGRIEFANPAMEALFRYERGEMRGKPVTALNAGPSPGAIAEEIMTSVERDGLWMGELTSIRKDGTTFVSEATVSAVRDANGDFAAVISVQRDITERKKAEQALRESESRFRTLAEVAPVGIYMTDTDGVCQFANRRWCEMAGLSPEEATGQGWSYALHPDDRERVYAEWNHVMTSGGSWEMEYRFVTPRGKIIWIHGHGTALLDDDGRPIGYIGADIDISRRKAAEVEQGRLLSEVVREQQSYATLAAVLQNERDILETIMENTRTHLAYLDRDFNFVTVNSAYAAGAQYRADELIGRNHFDLFPNEDNLSIFRKVRDTGVAVEFHRKPFTYPDQPERGTTYWDWSLIPVKDSEGAVLGLVLSLLDVTEAVGITQQLSQLRDEAELERRRLRAVLDALPVGVILADAEGRLLEHNPAFNEIWGGECPLSESPDNYDQYRAFDPGTGRPIAAHEWGLARAIANGEICINEEMEIETFDHKRKTILNYALPIRDIDTRIVGGVAVNVDITGRKHDQEALRQSEERLQLAQRLAQIGTWDWDILNDRLYWSDQVPLMLGLDRDIRETDVGQFLASVHPDDVDRITAAIEASLMAGRHYKEDHRVTYADGSVHWVEEAGDVILDNDGRAVRMVGMIYDITDRRLALEAKARLATIVESSPDAIIGKTLEGIITSWNQGAERIYGYSAREAIGSPITIIVPPEREQEERGILAELRDGLKVQQYETERVTKSGERRFVSLTISPIEDEKGRVVSVATIARDITERRQAEDSIRRMNDRLARQAADLARANTELEAFSYSVSHDLRAPLRSIDGFSMVLLEDYADKLDDAGRDYLNRVRGASQKMAGLIDDLLTLSRISRAQLHHEEVDLSSLANESIAALRNTEPKRTVEVSIAEGLTARADRRLVEIVVNNLLRNAWKFTSGKSEAKIEFGAFDDAGERIFVIRDNGAGFDMAYADKLFLPFQRLHSTSEYPGTGVGLSLVKRIIDRHGGRIWGEGKPGEGANFYFTL